MYERRANLVSSCQENFVIMFITIVATLGPYPANEPRLNNLFSFRSNETVYNKDVQPRSYPPEETVMIRTSFVAIALSALVGFTATAPAMANDVRIEQYGWSNSAGGAQEGYGNRIRTYQNGGYNRIVGHQYGRHNLSAVGQEGHDNYGSTYQNGSRNVAGIGQFGSNHTTILTQDGNGNIAAGVQVGRGCSANVNQGGNDNVAAFVQACP
jgi:hypothetical protein